MKTTMTPFLVSCFTVLLIVLPATHAADDNPQGIVEQRQAEKLEQLEADVASLKTMVSRLSQKVAFTAHFSTYGTVNVGDSSPMKFDAVVTNTGSAYNSHTGIFTAPVAGLYYFVLHLMHDDRSHHTIHVIIDKGNEELCRAAAEEVGQYEQGACQVATHLSQGEQVVARRTQGDDFLHGGPFTSFSGFLISADTD